MGRPSRAERIFLGLLLVLSLGSCTEPARPILEPFLVGRWEALELGDKRWVESSQIVSLVLYDDGTAALDNRKGTWVWGDLSRGSVRVEIPQRYEARTYELLLKNDEGRPPLWGTMAYDGKLLRFEQKENGGIVGTAGLLLEDAEEARVARERAERESAQAALHKARWKKRLAIAWHCLWYGALIWCLLRLNSSYLPRAAQRPTLGFQRRPYGPACAAPYRRVRSGRSATVFKMAYFGSNWTGWSQ